MESKDILLEGADRVMENGNNRAGLWYTETPKLNGKSVGTIGCCNLENSDSTVQFLTEAATSLNREHDCEIVIGPMNGNTWQKHRLIIESNDRDPFLLEPIEPDYYLELFEKAGFTIESTYTSSSINLCQELPDYTKLRNRIENAGYEVRPFDESNFDGELRKIYELSLASFADNFLYTPISYQRFARMYEKVRSAVSRDFVLMAEYENELAGFVFCLPNLPTMDALIVKTLATSPTHRAAGLGTDLVARVQETAKERGLKEAIHALQFEDNSSLRISKRFDATVFRKYALMSKAF